VVIGQLFVQTAKLKLLQIGTYNAYIANTRKPCRLLTGNSWRKCHFKDYNVDGRIKVILGA
jgi:hypothetical protein